MKTFFISGVQRSGTTLLSVILSNHPDIDLDGFSKAFRLISVLNNYEKVLPLNLQHSEDEVLKWKIEKDYKGRLFEFLDVENFEKYPDFRSLLHGSVERHLDKSGKKIWGDKSPNLQFYSRDIFTLFPEAKMIHIVRDGRATAWSHSVRAHEHILLAAQKWVDGNTAALVNQKLFGSKQHLILKYEDLLRFPEKTANELCDFLEIPFDKKMLVLNSATEERSYVKSRFDTSKINHFRKEIPPKILQKVESIQAPLLRKFGYDLVFLKTEKKAAPLSVFNWMRFRFSDAVRMLFRNKRMGMIDRKNVEVRISWRNRLSKFAMFLAHDYLPKRVYERIYERAFNKDRFYDKNQKS